MKKFLLLAVLILCLAFPVAAQERSGSLTLLTVAERAGGDLGGTASLNLDVKPGSGKIFISSFPLTKLDTQISTRFANEIACQQLELDCEDYDFFYTIEADSTIVGGPSAGGGIAVLTAAVMKDLPVSESVSMTGTINSGGILGPVAGVYAKIEAAQEKGIQKVVIPKWVSFNKSTFREETGRDLEIEVVKAGNMNEALKEFTGQDFNGEEGQITISYRYLERMEAVSDMLCNRTMHMANELEDKDTNFTLEANFTTRRNDAFNNSKFYTAASYCFSKNIELRSQLLEDEPNDEKVLKVQQLTRAMGKMDDEVDDRDLATLSDLETYMIVKERLVEASEALKEVNLANVSSSQLGYVMERYFSAVAWSNFFGLGGKAFTLEPTHLRNACLKKVSEAEERLDYVSTLSTEVLSNTKEELRLAEQDMERGRYALCIFKAGKAKAEADMFLLGISVREDDVTNVVSEKLEATKRVILDQQEKGIFPILGYSYYEYADSLKESTPSSALMFSEYALEMSNLELYFPQEKEASFEWPSIDMDLVLLFLFGAVFGFAISQLLSLKKRKK